MNTELSNAKDTLFGPEGLGVSDFKLFPGTSREATPSEFAREINKAVADVIAGDFDVVDFSAVED